MIELTRNSLTFTFPKVHPDARLKISFQRTLRIPDDGSTYSLPPGLGCFPLRHVDDFAGRVPASWIEHGGVMLPMYQSEAMWLYFDARDVENRDTSYPFAIKIAAGKINAVTGRRWLSGLHRRQDYVVAPEQPWLDGFCVEKGIIRQFVAMPLGAGYTAEEQLTGKAEQGGLQIAVYPMKRKAFEKRFPLVKRGRRQESDMLACMSAPAEMGLAPGGRMHQEIYEDPFDFEDWDLENTSRCFVHIANSLVWRAATGENPPTTPPTAKEYSRAGMPWFSYYNGDAKVLEGAKELKGMKSVVEMGKKKGDVPLPENETAIPERIIRLRKKLKENQVREGAF